MQRPSSRGSASSNMANNQSAGASSFLEQENDRLVENLRAKATALKSLTIDIGNEVRQQNKQLDEMDAGFDSGAGLLGSTMRRLGLISKSGGHRFTCYLALFAFAVFIVIWYMVK